MPFQELSQGLWTVPISLADQRGREQEAVAGPEPVGKQRDGEEGRSDQCLRLKCPTIALAGFSGRRYGFGSESEAGPEALHCRPVPSGFVDAAGPWTTIGAVWAAGQCQRENPHLPLPPTNHSLHPAQAGEKPSLRRESTRGPWGVPSQALLQEPVPAPGLPLLLGKALSLPAQSPRGEKRHLGTSHPPSPAF